MLQKIDDYFFDAIPGFQKIANFIEYFTYAPPAITARVVVSIGSAVYMSFLYRMYIETADMKYVAIIWAQGLLIVLRLFVAQLGEYTSSSTRNPLRNSYFQIFFRLTFVFLSTVILVKIFSTQERVWSILGFGSIAVAEYFLACDKLPPGNRFFDQFHKTVAA